VTNVKWIWNRALSTLDLFTMLFQACMCIRHWTLSNMLYVQIYYNYSKGEIFRWFGRFSPEVANKMYQYWYPLMHGGLLLNNLFRYSQIKWSWKKYALESVWIDMKKSEAWIFMRKGLTWICMRKSLTWICMRKGEHECAYEKEWVVKIHKFL